MSAYPIVNLVLVLTGVERYTVGAKFGRAFVLKYSLLLKALRVSQ